MLIRCIYCSVSVQLMSILRRSLNVFSEKATTSSSTTPQSAFFMNRSYYCCCALIQPSASAPGVLRFVLYGATYLSSGGGLTKGLRRRDFWYHATLHSGWSRRRRSMHIICRFFTNLLKFFWLYSKFPWRKCSIKALVHQLRLEYWYFLQGNVLSGHQLLKEIIFVFDSWFF